MQTDIGSGGIGPDDTGYQDKKLADLIAEQEAIFVRRQPGSARLADRARDALAGGVTSSWQITVPQPVWLSHGQGSKVYDVDGNEYVDLHGGYGAALAGHAHPAIARAISEQAGRGTHFAQPTPDAIAVATELAGRFGLPRWRFANSGTEAPMDAIHLMRSITGRDLIIKVEGCYHGHHDSVQVSVLPEPDEAGPADRPASAPASSGIPAALTRLTLVAGFNDIGSVARRLDEHPAVSRVRYPGLPGDPGHRIAAAQMTGFGAVLAFEVADAPTADRLCDAVCVIVHATSLGGVESTIERRSKLPGQEHVPLGLLRLSVGCEHIDDLWNDLNSALQHASRPDNPGPGTGRAERR